MYEHSNNHAPSCSIGDDRVQLRFHRHGDEILADLVDGVTGTVWGPTVPLRLQIYSIALRRVEEPVCPTVKIDPGDGWVDVTVTSDDLLCSASATVRFSVEHGEVVARIPSDRIFESRRELSLLSGVHVLPDLMTVSAKQAGHLVLPYRNGALCYPQRHGRVSEHFLIYGEQPCWERMPMLPCAGAVRERAQSALLTIVEQGDCDAECRVHIDGRGGGTVGFSMRYRYMPVDPVDPIDRTLRIVPLSGDDARYGAMGRRLHKFVLARAGRGTLAHRSAANPDLAYAANSFVLKIMLACKEIGPVDGSGRLNVFTTCVQAMDQLSTIKAAGIDRLWVQLVGWNLEGHDGCWPTRFPVEPGIGGDAGQSEPIAHGQALGFQMQLHDNYIDLMERSPDFDALHSVGDIYGGPLKRGCWAGGINYAGWGLALPESRLRGEMERVKALGVSGVCYIDAIGMPLEISHNPQHGARRFRRACAEGVKRIIRTGREVYGGSGVENGYLYCVTEADYIGNPFLESHGMPSSELVDVPIPLWMMAVKGHVFCTLPDTYNAAIDFDPHNHQTLSSRMMLLAEYGLLPRNEIVARRGAWGYPLEPALQAMRLEYDLIVDRLAGISAAALQDHRILQGDPATGKYVAISQFSDARQILCDYASECLEIDGEVYPLPIDYRKAPVMEYAATVTAQ